MRPAPPAQDPGPRGQQAEQQGHERSRREAGLPPVGDGLLRIVVEERTPQIARLASEGLVFQTW